MSYHPNYFEPSPAVRDCKLRSDMIKDTIGKIGPSCLDIGCSGGYYSFFMRDLLNGAVKGIDTEQDLIDVCNQRAEENNVKNVLFQKIELSDYLIHTKERYNVILYMSVHHHMIARHGMEMASYLLKTLSARCEVMYFDMGQKDEMCSQHKWWQRLPICMDQKKWLVDYLYDNTFFKKIEIVGSTPIHDTQRHFIRCEA